MKIRKPCEHCHGKGVEIEQHTFGRQQRQFRKRQGVAMKEVALAMKISAQYLNDMEHGRRAWSRTHAELFRRVVLLLTSLPFKEQRIRR